MASLLRGTTVDPDRVRDAGEPLLVDPDWQDLLAESTERAYREGHAEGIAEGRRAAEHATETMGTALDRAVEEVRSEVRAATLESTVALASTALTILARLTGELWAGEDTLNDRIRAALADLDGDELEVLVGPEDLDHVTAALSPDTRVAVRVDPGLGQGEARIIGQWCDADLRWETVLDVLREALDA